MCEQKSVKFVSAEHKSRSNERELSTKVDPDSQFMH